MDSLTHDDSRAELGRAHHRNRSGSQIPDVDGPWISLSIQFGRSHRQIDDRRRIEEFEELSTKVRSNCTAVWLQMNYLSFLERVRLAENQSDANKKRLHNCSIENEQAIRNAVCRSDGLEARLRLIGRCRAKRLTLQRQIKQQFDAIRNTYLFECPEEVVFHRVFAEF